MLVYTQVVCVCLSAAKFDQPTSRIDFCGSPFPVEMEIRKLPIAEKTRIICLDLPYYIKFDLSTFLLLICF